MWCEGAASDKVAALSKAGVIVTDSPAKIGSETLKVSRNPFIHFTFSYSIQGNEGRRLVVKIRAYSFSIIPD
jgi:hypothetical protein